MGFEDTLHQKTLTVDRCRFSSQDYEKLANVMKILQDHPAVMQELLKEQQGKVNESRKNIQGILGG